MKIKINPALLLLFTILLTGSSLPSDRTEARWWSVYFTNPGLSRTPVSRETPETALCRVLSNAEKSFYGAFYSLSSPRVAAGILHAHKRGVEIRIVLEKDNSRNPQIRQLADAGIPIVTDTGKRLMHNKFAIIDETIIWTGSYNLTENGASKDDNNAIEIHSPELSRIYLDEFREMYDYRIFGNRRESGIFPVILQKYYVKIGDTPINAYFSPENNVERILLNRLKKAQKSVHFMAFSFTSDPLGEELIGLHKKGLKISGVFEKTGSSGRESEYIKMKIEGIPVRLDRNRALMHHKVMIIDESVVVTGSYNFSKNASRHNDENILIIDNAEIAAEYLKEFRRVYGQEKGTH